MKKLNFLLLAIIISAFGTMYAQVEETAERKVLPAFKPTATIHGRIQADIEYNKLNEDEQAGFEFRRLYLSASGNIFTNLKYKAQVEFAGGKVGFRDVFIKATNLPYIGGNFVVGNYANPTGLDAGTSSKYISFLERAMVTSTQGFRWMPGFFYENYKLLDGKMTTQFAWTFNGDKSAGFKTTDLHMGSNFTARITGLPYKKGNNFVHLGVNYEFINTTNDAFKVSLRENHMGQKLKATISSNVKMQNDLGFELATVIGPVSVQGEYEMAMAMDKDDAIETKTVGTYYAMATFFITKGDHRTFKNGAFSRTKVKDPISWNKDGFEGGLGALELAVRYSASDFGDVTTQFGKDLEVGGVSNVTAGFNWYLNSHTKFMYNFIYGVAGENKSNDHMVRFAIDF